jgi:hypothetical protein
MNPKKLKSFDEEHREWREEISRDKECWDNRNKPKPVLETTREICPNEVINKPDLSQLLRSGKVLPASELAAQKELSERLASELEEAVRSEESHRRTKIKTEPDKTFTHFTREPFID